MTTPRLTGSPIPEHPQTTHVHAPTSRFAANKLPDKRGSGVSTRALLATDRVETGLASVAKPPSQLTAAAAVSASVPVKIERSSAVYVFQAFTDALCHHVATALACGVSLTVAASYVVSVYPVGLIIGGLAAAGAFAGLVVLPLWRLLRGQIPTRQTIARQRSVEIAMASTCVGAATGLFLGFTGTFWAVAAATAGAAVLLTAVSLFAANTAYKYLHKLVRYFDKSSITLDDPFWQQKATDAPHLLRASRRGKALLTYVVEARRDSPLEVTDEDWQLVRTLTADQIAISPSLLDDVATRQAVIDDPALAYAPLMSQKNKALRAVLASAERCALLDQWALAYLTTADDAKCRQQILQYDPWLPLLRFADTSEDALDRALANGVPHYDALLEHLRALLGHEKVDEERREYALRRRPKMALMPSATNQVLLQQVPHSESAALATYVAVGHVTTPPELVRDALTRLPTLPRLNIAGKAQFLLDHVPITPDVNTPAKRALAMQATIDLMVTQPRLDVSWHDLLRRIPHLATMPATDGTWLMDKFPHDPFIKQAALQVLTHATDNLGVVSVVLRRYQYLTVQALAHPTERTAGPERILLDCMTAGTPAHQLVEGLTVEHLASEKANKQRRIDVLRDRPTLLNYKVNKITLFTFLLNNPGMVNASSVFGQSPENINALKQINDHLQARVTTEAWVRQHR